MIWLLYTIAGIGLLSSIYMWYIHVRHAANPEYESMCDITETVACTSVVTGEYGSLVVLPNSVYGMIYYVLIMVLASFGFLLTIFWISILGLIGSAYLAYLLYYKLRQVCIVCTLTYIVNIALFVAAYLLMNNFV